MIALLCFFLTVPSQNSIRSRNPDRYRPNVDGKQDRNLNSLFGRENSLFFAENSQLGLQKFPVSLRREFMWKPLNQLND